MAGRKQGQAHPSRSAASYGRRVATRPIEGVDDQHARWSARPWLARFVRWTIFLVPIVVSFLFALLATSTLPEADSRWGGVGRWIGIAVASTVVLFLMQRIAKRFIPLAGLLSLTLVFPDSAPSRFGLALRTGTTRQLQAKIDHFDEQGLGDTPHEAAESLLELVAALSRHDRMTRGHSERVRAYSRMIGEELRLDGPELERLHWAGLVHDIGKLYVPEDILNKPDRLTDEEFAVVKEHTVRGQELVKPLEVWLGTAAAAVWEHHERWEGGGYPSGRPSEQLELTSRIVCVADAFDVMTSARSYKTPMSASLARAELERCAGTQFDPEVVRAMLTVSLGQLWAAMGPMSLLAQIRLFPRRLTDGGAAVAVAAAALLGVLLTAIAAGVPWADVNAAPADDTPSATAPADEPSAGDDVDQTAAPGPDDEAPPPSEPSAEEQPVTSAPTATTVPPPTSTTTSTTVPRFAMSTAPIIVVTLPATTTTVTTTPRTADTVTATTVAAPPTTRATTTTAPTTTPTTTATTTTSTIPAAPSRLTVASSALGDVTSRRTLDLLLRPPINSGLPNYDVDRNTDPGLTIERSAAGLASSDPAQVQAWRAPSGVSVGTNPIRLQMWFAPTSASSSGFAVVSAGLYDCAEASRECVPLAADTGVFLPVVGSFNGVSFELTPGSGGFTLAAGRVLEVRVATAETSTVDLMVAYDSVQYPASLTFGG